MGCDGATTCGQNVGGFDSKNNGVMATFTFAPRVTSKLESFEIVKSGMKKARSGPSSNLNLGCGKTVNWKKMASVPIHPEFQESAAVTTTDVTVVPSAARPVKERIGHYLKNAGRNIQFGNSKPY